MKVVHAFAPIIIAFVCSTGRSADPSKHWAFQPIRNPSPPPVKAIGVSSPIDRFIIAKLEDRGLALSPAVEQRTLIRRVTFDVTGLPPTPEEIEAFLNESATNTQLAYEKLIDRLLAAPRYGEHWGRHWLDVARYADTKGYVFFQDDALPWAWTYRDYVIEALNADLPYDQFLLQQLAADLLPLGVDKKPLRALGFLTLGGRFMNNPHDVIDDRIDVVTRGLLGLTATCARCHDHKFDPIPTKDYYSLYAIFVACDEPEVPPLYEAPPKTPEYEKFAAELANREGKLRIYLAKKRQELVRNARQRSGEYLLAAHRLRGKPPTDDFMLIADPNDLNPKMIVRWRAFLERSQKNPERVFGLFHEFANLPENEFAARARQVVASLKKRNDVNLIVAEEFIQRPPVSMADVSFQYGVLLVDADENGKVFGESDWARNLNELRSALYAPNAPANVAPGDFSELELLPDRASQGELQKFRKQVEQWRASGVGAPPRAMVLNDLTTRHEQHVFLRGSPTNLGERVDRRFLSILSQDPAPFQRGSGRLDMAKSIANASNPLTARVIANRVWMHHFGKGLVATPGDFGLRSEPPSHPKLLDYLASTLIADGWSLKKLHRRILLSATYRQSSADRPESVKIDPENTLLWKMPRHRLNFEETRDALLVAADRLDRKIGGPSVANFLSGSATRRTLYAHLDRLNVPGIFRTFDFPSPDAAAPQRDLTTIPPQSLFMMNHPFVVECAKNVLRRADVAAEKHNGKRLQRIHQILYGRPVREEEEALARSFLGNADENAWTRLVHALLQANEFVFVD